MCLQVFHSPEKKNSQRQHYQPNFLNNTAERILVLLNYDTLSLLLDEQQHRTTSVYPLQITEIE
jgi:hypothetical protein